MSAGIGPEGNPVNAVTQPSLVSRGLGHVGAFTYGTYKSIVSDHRLRPDQERYAGLTEGSLIAHDLLLPDAEGDLGVRIAPPGQVVARDFNRHTLDIDDKRSPRKIFTGYLGAMMLDSVAGNESGVLTPTSRYRMYHRRHRAGETLQRYAPEELIKLGFLSSTTYGEGYASLGKDSIRPRLQELGVEDGPVYRVTPKGHTLVFILGSRQSGGGYDAGGGDNDGVQRVRSLAPSPLSKLVPVTATH